jgi:glycosyltransferase involved in cell wall biosynthesis
MLNNRIRILEVIRQGQIGGGESHLLDLVEYLDKERFEPICLAFTDGEMIGRMKAMGIETHVIETQKPFDLKVQRQVRQLMKERGINVVHAHGSRAASNIVWPARQLHLPIVYTVHGWSFHDDQPWIVRKMRAWSEKLICHYARQVICVSQSNADTGAKTFGLRGCSVIENGINLRRFDPDGSYPDLRSKFGFAADDFIVAFIARNTKQKAPLCFLEALRLAHEQDSHIKGVFVGEGDLDSETDAYIEANRMGGYLYRSKFRLDVPDVLNAIDVYCLLSLWEGLSIALLEAMAMRKAIIATPTDGTRELISDASNGLVVAFNSPLDASKAMLRFKDDAGLRTRYGSEARKVVAERFNAARVASMVGEIYSRE